MTCVICSALAVVPGCGYCREEARDAARAAALRTFRRAMKRHEKRARRMGLGGVSVDLAMVRTSGDPVTSWLMLLNHGGGCFGGDRGRRARRMLTLAADAVARLRAALAEAT